jgi:hypothetical protein
MKKFLYIIKINLDLSIVLLLFIVAGITGLCAVGSKPGSAKSLTLLMIAVSMMSASLTVLLLTQFKKDKKP